MSITPAEMYTGETPNLIISGSNFYDNFTEEGGIYKVARWPRAAVPSTDKVPEQVRPEPKQHQKKGFDWLFLTRIIA